MTSIPQEKRCRSCHITKSASDFHKRSVSKDGLGSYCRTCAKKFQPVRTPKPLYKDITGQVFGKLTAIERRGRKHGGYVWFCTCECGGSGEFTLQSLHVGRKHCGCVPKPKPVVGFQKGHLGYGRKPYGEASRNKVLLQYRTDAKERGYAFDLTNDQAYELFQSNCFYCGSPPSQVCRNPNNNGDYTYNGIDRKDNTKGYNPDNVVSCCGRCNYMKRDEPFDVFIDRIKRIYHQMIHQGLA